VSTHGRVFATERSSSANMEKKRSERRGRASASRDYSRWWLATVRVFIRPERRPLKTGSRPQRRGRLSAFPRQGRRGAGVPWWAGRSACPTGPVTIAEVRGDQGGGSNRPKFRKRKPGAVCARPWTQRRRQMKAKYCARLDKSCWALAVYDGLGVAQKRGAARFQGAGRTLGIRPVRHIGQRREYTSRTCSSFPIWTKTIRAGILPAAFSLSPGPQANPPQGPGARRNSSVTERELPRGQGSGFMISAERDTWMTNHHVGRRCERDHGNAARTSASSRGRVVGFGPGGLRGAGKIEAADWPTSKIGEPGTAQGRRVGHRNRLPVRSAKYGHGGIVSAKGGRETGRAAAFITDRLRAGGGGGGGE